MNIGNAGGTGELWIQNGGQVASNVFAEGPYFSAIGREGSSGLVVVEGPGSLWQQHGNLDRGIAVGAGGSGTAIIRSGGKVISSNLTVGGYGYDGNPDAPGNGLVTLDGLGSQWTTDTLRVGDTGTGQLLISNGGRLINNNRHLEDTVLGSQYGSFGRIVVDGVASQWIDNSQQLIVADGGTAELSIQNGAMVTSNEVLLGRFGGHGEANISGPGSRWSVAYLSVGEEGSAQVEIRDGATLNLSTRQRINVGPQGEIILTNGNISMSPAGQMQVRGTLGGSGQIHGHVEVVPQGRLQVHANDRLLLREGLFNGGHVEVVDGELEIQGGFSDGLNNRGAITMENASLRIASPHALHNHDTIAVASGNNRFHTPVDNFSDGSMVLSGNSQTTFYDDVYNGGQINVSTGSTATFFGQVSGNGIGGGGTVFLEGEIAPGFSPGTMTFGGDLNLGDFSSLALEISGDMAGTEHDQLQVAGTAALDGELLLSAQAPLGDVTLTILEAESIVGEFDSVPLFSHIGAGMFVTDITFAKWTNTLAGVPGSSRTRSLGGSSVPRPGRLGLVIALP